jgi:ribosomal protein S18 acetylase RimI-like enzyme
MTTAAREAATSDQSLAVTAAEPGHAPALASIHFGALPGDFLPSLGADFLERVYYPATFRSAHGANLMVTAAGRPVGFVTIAHDSPGFSRDLVTRAWLRLAYFAARAAIRRPSHLRLSLEVVGAALFGRPDPLPGEIVLIAVDAGHRGRGIGKALVAAALEYLRRHGIDRCRTKTLASNAGVIAMYEGLGWHIRDRFRLIGRDYVTLVSPGPPS